MKPGLYERIYFWLVAHRPWVLAATLLLAIFGIAVSSRLQLEEDILGILPQGDKFVDDYKYTVRKFKQIDRVYIDVGRETNTDPASLGKAADDFYNGLKDDTNFTRIMYRVDISGVNKSLGLLTSSLPDLLTEADVPALAAKLATNEVRQYLTEMRRRLATQEGMIIKDIIPVDPIGMSSLVYEKVLPLQTGFGDAKTVDGRITSGDGRHVLILAEPAFSSSNSKDSVALVAKMVQLKHDIEARYPGIHVAITGGHRMSVDNASLIKGDAQRCIFLGMGAMLVLCLSAYRRKWLSFVTFLPSLFGTLMAAAILVLWDRHLSAIATGFATIAIGITVDYGIYIVYHLDNAAKDRKSAAQIVRRLLTPMAIGVSTIIAAFLVLSTSPMRGYRQLGIFGAMGVIISAAMALFILPLLIPLPKEREIPPLRFSRWMEAFHTWQVRWRPLMLLAVVVVTIATALGLHHLRFEGDITKMNGITKSTAEDDEIIRKAWGDALSMTMIVARGTNLDEALTKTDAATRTLKSDTNVQDVFSLAAICPSHETQVANIQRWHAFWTPERQADLRNTLRQVGGELGLRADAFEPFWKVVQGEPQELTVASFKGTPLEEPVNERVALAPGDNAVGTIVKLKHREYSSRLATELPGMIVMDSEAFAEHIAALAEHGMGYFALWTTVVVGAIVYFSLASIELVVATLLPLGLGLLWTLGLMGWLGLPVDMMNSVFVIFIIGIGEDYGVFLATSKLDVWRGHPPRIAPTSASVMISAVTTICGFAVLVFARHPVLYSLGTTVLLGMLCTFAATLVVTPACMDLLLFRDPPRGAPRWWHLIGTIWVTLHLGGSELFLYYILRPILKLVSPRTADDRLRRATRWMARGVVKGMPFGKLEYQNIAPETFSPPCIVISNHQSAVDVMLIVALPGDVRQTAKKRVFDTPTLGIGCKLLGHVLVEPNDPETTLQRCKDRLAEGACVHFYPEGTRSQDGFVQRFHLGAFELAVQLRQEILPIVLCDTNTAMPRDSYWFEPYHVTVRALPRVTPKNFDYSLGTRALAQHCEKLVRDALQRQLDELNTPKVLRRKVQRLYRYQGIYTEQFIYWKMRQDPMFPVLNEVVPQRGFILDLGCGYGIVSHWLAFCTDQRTVLGVDYDETKIRIAQRSAPNHPRVRFELQNIFDWEFPDCDAVLLMDVLHYWLPEKQQFLLSKARRALRPGGKLLLRAGARSAGDKHERVRRWETIATRIGHNQTGDGLHFMSLEEMTAALRTAGFSKWEIRPDAGRDSNVLLVASA